MKSRPAKPTKICYLTILIVSLAASSLGVASTSARAETQQIDSTVTEAGSSFAVLTSQAEELAKREIERAFLQDPSITKVSARISGQYNGNESVILVATVYRSDWRTDPSMSMLHRWTKYFDNSEILLGFLSKQPSESPPPILVPNVTPYRGD